MIGFSAVLSLTPLGSFPPRALTFTTPAISIPGVLDIIPSMTITFTWMTFLVFIVATGFSVIVILNVLGNMEFKALGSGTAWNINAKYLSTIVIGLMVAGAFAFSLIQMLPSDIPMFFQFFLVWPWVILLVYSVIIQAGIYGGGSE